MNPAEEAFLPQQNKLETTSETAVPATGTIIARELLPGLEYREVPSTCMLFSKQAETSSQKPKMDKGQIITNRTEEAFSREMISLTFREDNREEEDYKPAETYRPPESKTGKDIRIAARLQQRGQNQPEAIQHSGEFQKQKSSWTERKNAWQESPALQTRQKISGRTGVDGNLSGTVPEGIPSAPRQQMEPFRLTYTQLPPVIHPETATAEKTDSMSDQEKTQTYRNLPPWAQNLLNKTGDATSFRFNAGQQNAGVIGNSPPKESLPEDFSQNAGTGKQITWTAPIALPSTPTVFSSLNLPAAPIVFRDRETERETGMPPIRAMDEREIRRTADRVYRMIEERLRKELRRGGK